MSRTLRARDNGAADSIHCLRGVKRRTTTRIKPTPAPKPSRPVTPGKLSYNERRELEQRQQELTADPAFYKQAAVTQRLEELRTLEAELEAAYERWAALKG